MSRFGRQPVADILRRRGISRVQVSKTLGVKYSILNNTLAGHQAPSPMLREGLPEMLGEPLEKLFTAEPLAREQGRRYRSGAEVSRGDDTRIVRSRTSRSDGADGEDSDSDSESDSKEDDREVHAVAS
jgi:hypothetical protein